jgi:hypothetical protein
MPALWNAKFQTRGKLGKALRPIAVILAFFFTVAALPVLAHRAESTVVTDSDVIALRTGHFIWTPDLAPDGPMMVAISLSEQRVYVYRDGILIGASTISSGRPGYETPTGIFTILEKAVKHRSNRYSNAPMPYMERLTWYGVAMHAGHLPGYAASHGCVRMPFAFSKALYKETSVGTTVVVSDGHPEPESILYDPNAAYDPATAPTPPPAATQDPEPMAGTDPKPRPAPEDPMPPGDPRPPPSSVPGGE